LALAKKLDNELYNYRMLNTLGWLYSELGDLERALDLNQRSAEGARQRGDPEVIANAELNLADIFLSKGDLHLAQECLDGVYRLAHDPATSNWAKWRYSTRLFASLGELWLTRGAFAKAGECAAQCLDIAIRTNSRKYIVKGWRLQGEIASAHRQWDEAERWLGQASPLAHTIGNPSQLWKTHAALGRLHTARHQPDKARQAYQAARNVLEHMKGHVQHPELRSSLECSALFQEVYEFSSSDG
jgi:tetratricopeptide (TPR) repeat protein